MGGGAAGEANFRGSKTDKNSRYANSRLQPSSVQ
jgi:hypothetical protein